MSIYNQNDKGMDGRTLIAVVLSVIVVTVGFSIQSWLSPPAPPAQTVEAVATPEAPASAPLVAEAPVLAPSGIALPTDVVVEAPEAEAAVVLKTDVFEATFTNKGGELRSLKLLKHADREGVMDLVLPGSGDAEAFALSFGGPDAAPMRELMNVRRVDDTTIEFWRTLFAPGADGSAKPFTLRKRFTFKPGEYMFRLDITLENAVNEFLPLDTNGKAYSLTYGPQIGPVYGHLAKNSDFRKFVVLLDGKRKEIRPKGGLETKTDRVAWSAISGKYFALIAIPDSTAYDATYESTVVDGRPGVTAFSFSRPAIKSSKQTDTFLFYAGPKSSKELARYDAADRNAFKRNGDRLEEVLEGGNILGWLESILKVLLTFFYGLIPNFGVAIILVTIFVKVVMFPLTKKGSEATARMADFQPKIKELQEKYKANPQKLNQEMAALYQREGYNPLSGCLPMLIQFPLFIAMYSLFNNHFDLRGASFIPGWIPDLSQPEAIYEFATVNLVLWKVSAIRVLPIVYLGSQLLYGVFTQQPAGGQSAGQMKFMMYGMPIMFFFILYDVPSGLLVYWIASNILTIVQQIAINKILHRKRLARAAEQPAQAPKLIVPNKGTRKK